jgi:zinc transporter, ZIP family
MDTHLGQAADDVQTLCGLAVTGRTVAAESQQTDCDEARGGRPQAADLSRPIAACQPPSPGYRTTVLEAGIWGLVAASPLVIGAWIGLRVDFKPTPHGLLLGFGAGTLISALSYELVQEAFTLGGADVVAAGLAAGALTYFLADRELDERGAKGRMSPDVAPGEGSRRALMLGALLDGVPESAVLGITVLEGEVSLALLGAVVLSNLPEGAGSTAARRGQPAGPILLAWILIALACAVAAALGYGLLDGASGNLVGFIEAFAGGAVLMTVTDAMLPDAQRLGGKSVGLATVLGFALAALLSSLG